MIRAKMKVYAVKHEKDVNGTVIQEQVNLQAVYSEDKESENYKWSQWTPSASFLINISNPTAMYKLEVGKEYFVDLTEVT